MFPVSPLCFFYLPQNLPSYYLEFLYVSAQFSSSCNSYLSPHFFFTYSCLHICTERCLCRVASELIVQSVKALGSVFQNFFHYLYLLLFRIPCLTTLFGGSSSRFSLGVCPTKLTRSSPFIHTPSVLLFIYMATTNVYI